ncbi:IclR family transcriptional regulator [Paracoccus sp. PS-1]|uniref:IclR family transcriptional regulator n=1 Tax=unclassified Paracoccus (in: a-proteobacteria) TaxID=2688777 RepID=UPI00048CC619|nr:MULTISPECIES: IclR family transcriptional regulator [unclassified Paracoccus (in: a-proteobacteria)]MDQ7260999.1 IclR family transcriptional regulator [Paracoccus sp. PS1]UFM63797.1 IclR family transcriptional regulator [Paracoccus sp. MA]
MQEFQDSSQVPPSLRNLQILEVLAREARPLTATEINASLGLPKPTIHRLVATLEHEGYLSRQLDGRSYLPGDKLRQMMLGVMHAAQFDLPRHDVLVRLFASVGETCSISIPEGDSLVYVDRVETSWPLRLVIRLGTRVPLHATAAGKVCLAHMNPQSLEHFLRHARLQAHTPNTFATAESLREELARIRAQGHATDEQEFIPGMIGVSVPALDARGRVLAALTFHAPVERMPMAVALTHLPALKRAASELAALA